MRLPTAILCALLILASCAADSPAKKARPAMASPTTAAAPRVIEGRDFTAGADREALEIVGEAGTVVRRCTFHGGSSSLRFVDCRDVVVQDCTFYGPLGTPDPDGQDLQFIRTTGTVLRCTFKASAQHSEDLLSIYSDRQLPADASVHVEDCTFDGKGPTDSGTSACVDGPFPPATSFEGCTFTGARCGVTIAAGSSNRMSGCTFSACGTAVYVFRGYGKPVGAMFAGIKRADVLIGDGVRASAVVFQN